MKAQRKRRLYFVVFIVLGISTAVGISLLALGQEVDLYFTPSQLITGHIPLNRSFRMGGMVKKGSFHRYGHTLKVGFVLTDFKKNIPVQYTGILPALFRAGQGIVVQGKLNNKGVFIADQVLAKHDNKYKPPGV